MNTDESPLYDRAGKGFAAHDTVNHSEGGVFAAGQEDRSQGIDERRGGVLRERQAEHRRHASPRFEEAPAAIRCGTRLQV